MDIIYWSDYACPYCYIGETNLKKAARELGIDDLNLKMMAFELDPNASNDSNLDTVDRLAQKYRISAEQALENVNSISIAAKEAGIDFDYSKTKYSNTFDAHRLTKLARDLGKEEAMAEELFKAYFVDHKQLADKNVLLDAAEAAGISREQAEEILNSDKYADEVRIDEQVAHSNGINAVPFFIVNGEFGIPGALPVEVMKEVLEEVINKDKKALN